MITELDDKIILESKDVRVHLLASGATIYRICTIDKNGDKDNILLSLPTTDEHAKAKPYYGMTCGRTSGRIKNGEFKLDGNTYNVTKNDGNNHLHGGNVGISYKKWDYKINYDSKGASCIFTTTSDHLEEGYPGKVKITVTYILKGNKLTIKYNGITDRRTFLNLTNHAYFNLDGNKKDTIYEHNLYVDSSNYIGTNSECIPTDIIDVTNTPYDFRTKRKIGNLNEETHPNIKIEQGIDNPFLLDEKSGTALTLESEKTGRFIDITTSYPAIVLYTSNKPNDDIYDDGVKAKQHIAIAIEPQYLPDAINRDEFEMPIIDVAREYDEIITYTFGVR